jgi:hypothetical protein
VYRVQALPESMLPLVWDFGQLDTRVETLYVQQMVRRWVSIVVLHAMSKTLRMVERRSFRKILDIFSKTLFEKSNRVNRKQMLM